MADDLEQPTDPARRAEALFDQGDAQGALEILKAATDSNGPQPALLWAMARARFALGEFDEALTALEQATLLEPSTAQATRRRVEVLSSAGLVRQALETVEATPLALREDPAVRETMREFYADWQYFAHSLALGRFTAKDGFTVWDRAGLQVAGWVLRHWPWLRARVLKWERENLLEPTLQVPPHLARLERASGLAGNALTSLRTSMDVTGVRLRYWLVTWRLRRRWQWRMVPGAVIVLWPTLWLAAAQLPRADRPGALAPPTLASSTLALSIALLVFVPARSAFFWSAMTTRRAALQAAAVVAVVTGGVEASIHRLTPIAGWQFALSYGLIAAPAVTVCTFAAFGAIEQVTNGRQRRAMEHFAQFDILNDLLWVLHRVLGSAPRRVIGRIVEADRLDWAAVKVQFFLLPRERRRELSEGAWLYERAAGWAEALRHLERTLIAANPGQNRKIERTLCHEIRCLAAGELGALAWRAPQPQPPRRAGTRSTVLSTAREIALAALPLAAVLASRPLVHFDPGLFGWAVTATGAWALLNLVFTLDPRLSQKLATAQQFADILRNRPGDTDASPKAGAPS